MSAQSTCKSSVLVALLVILALLLPMSGPSSAAPRAETARSGSIMFIENVGQFAEAARFQVRGGTGTMWLADDSIWITVLEPADGAEKLADAEPTPRKGINVRLSFPGANPHARLEPFHRLDTHVSYFIGNDPSHWHSDVPVWGGVKYRNLYPGVDLILGETQDGTDWRFDVHRGATTPSAPFQVEGLPDARHPDGRQLLTTALGPRATADNPGQLYYGTYFGGGGPYGSDIGTDVAVDGTGAIYLTGFTWSSDFPTTPGAFDSSLALIDAFVAKLMPNGNGTTDLIYSTLIGGVHDFNDFAYAIAVDASGHAHITGETSSNDFPNTHCTADGCLCPYRGTGIGGGGPSDAFLTTLNPTGTGLLNSTFIGGAYGDYATDLVYQGGYLYLTGTTTSADFPVSPNAFDPTYNGGNEDAFVMKLADSSPGCVPTYSTYLGSSYRDFGDGGIAVGADGTVYATGSTRLPAAPDGSDFPVTPGAFDTTGDAGGLGVFVARLRPAGYGSADLLYSTFLHGSGGDVDGPVRLALDSTEAILVTGRTHCSDFPTTPGAFDVSYDGFDGSFVSRLVPAGNGAQDLAYSTFLDGIVTHDIAIDQDDAVYVMGTQFYGLFPTTLNAFETDYNGGSADFAMSKLVLGSAGSRDLVYSTYIGGADSDTCYNRCGIAVDSSGVVYVAGYSSSSDFPVSPGAYDTTYHGGNDAVVIGLVLPPEVAASSGGSAVALIWAHSTPYASYEIWRHTTPYFDPISPPATLVASGLPPAGCTLTDGMLTCSRSEGIGNTNINYFYVVRGIRPDGAGVNSNRVGEFDFALVPGN